MLIGAQVAGNLYNRFLAGAPALSLEQWNRFWWYPAAFAAAILVFFVLAFRERTSSAAGGNVRAGRVGTGAMVTEPGR